MKMIFASIFTTILIVAMSLGTMFILVQTTIYVTAIQSTAQRAAAIGAELLLAWYSCLAQSGSPPISLFAFLAKKILHPLERRLSDKKKTLSASASNHHDRMEELRKLSAEAEAGGGVERREKEHKAGKLTARERIHLLLDENSFEELDKFVRHNCVDFGMETQRPPGDGFVTGFGAH